MVSLTGKPIRLVKMPCRGLFPLLRLILQNIPRLTMERLANRIQRGETDRLGLAVFEDRNIGHRDAHLLREFGDTHFSFGQHDVNVDDDSHILTQ